MKYIGLISLLGLFVLVGAGCNFDFASYVDESTTGVMDDMTLELPSEEDATLIDYDLGEVPAEVEEEFKDPADIFTVDGLVIMSQECGKDGDEQHFGSILSMFDGKYATEYTFTYAEESQGSGKYAVLVLPNAPGYAAMAEFKSDFEVCALGGLYPKQFNGEYLLFTAGCGGGFDDGSGLPHGCDIIKTQLDETLQLAQ
jgi:hypothetical protein